MKNSKKLKMEAKNIMVSLFAIASVLFLLIGVLPGLGATDVPGHDYTILEVEVNGQDADGASLEAGDRIRIEVEFESFVSDRDVTVKVELNGNDVDVSAETREFNVLPGDKIRKVLTLEISEDLEDELFDDDVDLEIEIRGDDSRFRTDNGDFTLTVKRSPFVADIKSISFPQTITAGDTFPVDVVLQNVGFNDLDDVYITVSIPALGLWTDTFLGDIVALECDDNDDNEFPWGPDFDTTGDGDGLGLDRNCNEDDEDSVAGRLFLTVPFDVAAGTYILEVEVENDDTTSTATKEITISNNFESNIFVSGNTLWVVNPTNNVVGYRIVPESPASVSDSVVFVPAGSSDTITVSPNAEGDYTFDVNVFSMTGELIQTVTFSGTGAEGSRSTVVDTSNPIVVMTVILAIIFIVLLVVLIVLLGKKPAQKSEEFGESYY